MDIDYICRNLCMLSGLSVRIYDNEKLLSRYMPMPIEPDPAVNEIELLLAAEGKLGYHIDRHGFSYGYISHEGKRIIIGPTRYIRMNDREIHEFAFYVGVLQQNSSAFETAIKLIPAISFDNLVHIICVLYYVFSGEKTSAAELICANENQSVSQDIFKMQLEKAERDANEQTVPHNTLELETALLNYIKLGDSEGLHNYIDNMGSVNAGLMSENQLSQYKTTFIVTATLASRAAITGGLDPDEAFTLSDLYIRQTMSLYSIDKILSLQYSMLLDYAERVGELRFGGDVPELVISVRKYVRAHISEAILTEDIAASLFMSRSSLSTNFHACSGKTLGDFILGEKVAEAKKLLAYSDKSLSAISCYLGFSSQSHFTNVFKKYAHCLPNEYRKKNK